MIKNFFQGLLVFYDYILIYMFIAVLDVLYENYTKYQDEIPSAIFWEITAMSLLVLVITLWKRILALRQFGWRGLGKTPRLESE